MKQIYSYRFKNWGQNIHCPPRNYFQPETEEELIELIRSHDKIRVIGSGHSWSDICVSEGILINLDHLNEVLEVDPINFKARVQAGIKLKNLTRKLFNAGLAMANLGSIDEQSVAGAISTGTHGTGIDFQILGSQVIEWAFIKADGEKVYVNKINDPELYHASIINLGSLGVISELTIQAVPAFNLHDFTTILPFDEVIENLDDYIHKNDHFKLWWLPPAEKVVVFQFQRTNEKRRGSRFRQFLIDEVLSVVIYRSLVTVARFFPSLSSGINRFLTFLKKGPLDRIETSDRVFIVPEPPKHRETEWAFDVKDAKEILKDYRNFIIEKQYPLNFIQEVRFSKQDEFWLSGSYQRNSIWLGIYAYDHENWDEILKAYHDFAMKRNGRPHWGKEFYVSTDYLEKIYPQYHRFKNLRSEWDPDGKFVNDYIARHFPQ